MPPNTFTPKKSRPVESLARWYLVSLWIESERADRPDICRKVSVLAKSHQDADERAERALHREWPRFARRLWCTSSEAEVCTDI